MAQAAFRLLLPDSGTSCVSHTLAHLLLLIPASPQHMANSALNSSFDFRMHTTFVSLLLSSRVLPCPLNSIVLTWLTTSLSHRGIQILLYPLVSRYAASHYANEAQLVHRPVQEQKRKTFQQISTAFPVAGPLRLSLQQITKCPFLRRKW